MNQLFQKGLDISKSLVFSRMLKRAPGILSMPVKLGMLLTSAYTVLTKDTRDTSGFEQVRSLMLTFVRMVKAYANGSYRQIPTKSILLGVGVLIYLVSPLDLVPDFIPGLGFLDDLGLITWLISNLRDQLDRFEQWEITQHFSEAGAGHS